jgi:DNA-binding transcriptional MerR regulator
MSHKLTCIVTGKTITVGNEYYDKKVSQFGSEDKFNSLYVSRQVKSLLKRGYKVKEIKELLKIERTDLPEVTDKIVKEILKTNDEDIISSESTSIKKSDPEVAEYIQNLRDYLS